jgi:hypothetical protein
MAAKSFCGPIRASAANLCWAHCRCQRYAVAQVLVFANAVSSSVWAVSFGYAAYWAGREFEQSHRHVVVFLLIMAMIVIIVAGIFVHRREAQLIAEAERAMPGPLRN